jgi:hypothetical protein
MCDIGSQIGRISARKLDWELAYVPTLTLAISIPARMSGGSKEIGNMAQRVVVELVDDLDGSVLKEGAGETVTFSLDGRDYEIDLKTTNAKALRKALEPYVSVASRVGKKTGTRGKRTQIPQVGPEASVVKAWARENGYEVADRGRVPAEIREAYEKAHA